MLQQPRLETQITTQWKVNIGSISQQYFLHLEGKYLTVSQAVNKAACNHTSYMLFSYFHSSYSGGQIVNKINCRTHYSLTPRLELSLSTDWNWPEIMLVVPLLSIINWVMTWAVSVSSLANVTDLHLLHQSPLITLQKSLRSFLLLFYTYFVCLLSSLKGQQQQQIAIIKDTR